MRELRQDEMYVVNGAEGEYIIGAALTVFTIATGAYMPPALAEITMKLGLAMGTVTGLLFAAEMVP